MDNTTNPNAPLTARSITRTEVEAVRAHVAGLTVTEIAALIGPGYASELVANCDAALAAPFPGEANYDGDTRTDLWNRGQAAKALTAIRAADAAAMWDAVSGQPEGVR